MDAAWDEGRRARIYRLAALHGWLVATVLAPWLEGAAPWWPIGALLMAVTASWGGTRRRGAMAAALVGTPLAVGLTTLAMGGVGRVALVAMTLALGLFLAAAAAFHATLTPRPVQVSALPGLGVDDAMARRSRIRRILLVMATVASVILAVLVPAFFFDAGAWLEEGRAAARVLGAVVALGISVGGILAILAPSFLRTRRPMKPARRLRRAGALVLIALVGIALAFVLTA